MAYTDSGGSTAYYAYLAALSTSETVGPSGTTVLQISSGLTGAVGTIVTMTQTSTNLAWVSEQLTGATITSGQWGRNGGWWYKESAAAANMGPRLKIQQLSSNSTFIDNISVWTPAGEMSATGYTQQSANFSVPITSAIAVSDGQRLAIILQASSAGNAQGSGNVVNFEWAGTADSASVGYQSHKLPGGASLSTLVSAPAAPAAPPVEQPIAIMQSVMRAAFHFTPLKLAKD